MTKSFAAFSLSRSLIREFMGSHDSLSDKQATDLATRALDIFDLRTGLRRKYFKLMSDEVSPVIAVQFLQLQSQFETMGDLEMSGAVPLAGH